jgi:hypothetical protein
MSVGSVRDDPDIVIAVVVAKTGDSLRYVSPNFHENLMKNTEKTRASYLNPAFKLNKVKNRSSSSELKLALLRFQLTGQPPTVRTD